MPAQRDAAGRPITPVLEVDGVTLQYKSKDYLITATYRVSLDVYRSDRFVLLGPSGCGKSTLLKGVAGYMNPVEGEIRLKGRKITEPGPDRMMVFQEFDQLLPWKTVKQNITFALRNSGRCQTAKEADEIAMEYIGKVRLTQFEDTYPHMLSGGMKQRVAIARGMAMRPDILLMDEPFAALDEITRFRLNNDLLALWRNLHKTVIFVTHSVFESVYLSQRVIVMTARPGRIGAEFHINSAEPRGEEFRTSAEYAAYCREVSHALAPSYAGQAGA